MGLADRKERNEASRDGKGMPVQQTQSKVSQGQVSQGRFLR